MIRQTWSKEEDRVLLEQVESHSIILTAFKHASKELDRPVSTVRSRYYKLKSLDNRKPDAEADVLLTQIAAVLAENRRLKAEVEELKKSATDFEYVARVLKQANKLLLDDATGVQYTVKDGVVKLDDH